MKLVRSILFSTALLIVSVLVSLFLAEGCLTLLKFPDDAGMQITSAPNYSAQVNFAEYSYSFKTNSQGIRYRELPFKKSAGESRFLVLGDSCVQGVGVESEETFTMLLEKQFSRPASPVNFINCGLAGAAPLDYARFCRYVGMQYRPDGVIIVISANDVADTDAATTLDENYGMGAKPLIHAIFPKLYALLRRVRDGARAQRFGGGKGKQFWVDAMIEGARRKGVSEERISAWRASLPPDLLQAANDGRMDGWVLAMALAKPDYWMDALDIASPAAEAKWTTMRSVLSRMTRQAKEKGLWVGVVLAPVPFQYDEAYGSAWRVSGMKLHDGWTDAPTEIEKRLAGWAKDESVPYLDMTPGFRKAQISGTGPLHYTIDSHMNKTGNTLAAKLIGDWFLKERGGALKRD